MLAGLDPLVAGGAHTIWQPYTYCDKLISSKEFTGSLHGLQPTMGVSQCVVAMYMVGPKYGKNCKNLPTAKIWLFICVQIIQQGVIIIIIVNDNGVLHTD